MSESGQVEKRVEFRLVVTDRFEKAAYGPFDYRHVADRLAQEKRRSGVTAVIQERTVTTTPWKDQADV